MNSDRRSPQLSFDVLGLIFSHYAEEESIQYPLETLLLVCRSWSNAALGHRSLWSDFRIIIGHEPTISMWNARLPLRLARCAPHSPLDILLRNQLASPYEERRDSFTDTIHRINELCHPCSSNEGSSGSIPLCRCSYAARACVDSCLRLLTGLNGELCSRWRSFKLILGDMLLDKESSRQVQDTLSYPMPILSKLVLEGLVCYRMASSGSRMLPDMRELKQVNLLDCDLSSLADFRNTVKAEVGLVDTFYYYDNVWIFRLWESLQELSLWVSAEVRIEAPLILSELRILNLIIDWYEFPGGLLTCEMPLLTTLSLKFYEYRILCELLQCKGIDWSKLKVLTLDEGHVSRERDIYPTDPHSLVKLLTWASSLEYLYATKGTLRAVLAILGAIRSDSRFLSNGTSGELLRGACIVSLYDNSSVVITGTESAGFLKELSVRWDCA